MTGGEDFPSHAAAIWIGAKGELRLGLPAALGHSTSHAVSIPQSAEGVRALVRILSARLQSANSAAKIGTPSVPHQALIDALASPSSRERLAAHKAKIAERERVEALSVEELLAETLEEWLP